MFHSSKANSKINIGVMQDVFLPLPQPIKNGVQKLLNLKIQEDNFLFINRLD